MKKQYFGKFIGLKNRTMDLDNTHNDPPLQPSIQGIPTLILGLTFIMTGKGWHC